MVRAPLGSKKKAAAFLSPLQGKQQKAFTFHFRGADDVPGFTKHEATRYKSDLYPGFFSKV